MNKAIVRLLSTFVCLSVILSGCAPAVQPTAAPAQPTQEVEEEPPAEAGVVVTEPGTFPIVKEKVTLSSFSPQYPTTEDLWTNELTIWYEQQTNVHIDWQLAPSEGFTEKRNLVLASGQYPDFFHGGSFPMVDQMLYGKQGVLIPLNDLIDQYTVHAKKFLEDYPVARDLLTAPDGNIYALGNAGWCYHCSLPQKLWMNTTWLKQLGLEQPTTTDELYNVLKAFKEQDPNGNGKADEIPLIAFGPENLGYFMCAFVYDDGVNRFILNNGTIEAAYTTDEWREGLRFLNKLYAEGLLDDQTFTLTAATELRQLGESEEAMLLGAVPTLWFGGFTSLAGERQKNYDAVPPIMGPEGVQTTKWNPYTAGIGEFAITKDCENPEVAIRWIDWFYSTEGGLRSRIGREGHEWRWCEPGETALDGETQCVWTKLTAIGEAQNYFWGQGAWLQQFIHSEQGACKGEKLYDVCGLEHRLFLASKQYEPYKPDAVVAPLWVGAEDIGEMAHLQTDINDYVNESMALFITGRLDLDKDWDSYLAELESIGLQRYLEINQAAYDAKYK